MERTPRGESILGSLLGRSRTPEPCPLPGRWVPERVPGVVNDAAPYGVSIEPADVRPGDWVWRAVRVHHLSPDENGGGHSVYIDAWETPEHGPAGSPWQPLTEARFKITWGDDGETLTADRPAGEPSACFPLWKRQVVAVQALGPAGPELPSDRVVGIHTDHPDEGEGNARDYHSFYVTFCRMQAPTSIRAQSEITAEVRNGAGRALLLLRDGREIARQIVPDGQSHRFERLPAGNYQVAVEGTAASSAPLVLDGVNTVHASLALPGSGRALAHYVLFGPVERPATQVYLLLAQDYLLAFAPAFGFSPQEAASASEVTIVGDADAVGEQAELSLAAGGARVQRIAGNPAEIAAALKERIARGRAF